jgi:hypothetical protein
MPIANPSSFHLEARFQVVCALCGSTGRFQAHHVVDKATLGTHCGLDGDDLYDTRNALRLCEGLETKRCHMQFENRRVTITTAMLTDDNIEYAFEKLGAYAADYLRREYDDSAADPRIERKLAAT